MLIVIMAYGRATSLSVLLGTIIGAVLPAAEFVSPYTVTRNVMISDTLDLAATAKSEGLLNPNKTPKSYDSFSLLTYDIIQLLSAQ